MPPDRLLDSVLADFQVGIGAYYLPLGRTGLLLLGTVALLQFAYLCAHAVMSLDIHRMIRDIIVGVIRIGVIWGVLGIAAAVGGSIVETCRIIAEQVCGLGPGTVTPSGIWDLGGNVFHLLMGARSWMMWFYLGDDVLFVLFAAVTYFAYFTAGLLYLWVNIQFFWAVIIGPALIPWSMFEPAAATFYAWGENILAGGIRLLAMLLILAVGMVEVRGWAADFAALGIHINDYQLYYATRAMLEAILFALMVGGFSWATARMVRTSMGGGPVWDDSGAWSLIRTGQAAANLAISAGTTVAVETGQGLGALVQSKLSG
jgi:hypothetical protein